MSKDTKSTRPRPTVANLEGRVGAIENSAATKEDLQAMESRLGEQIKQLASAAASKEDVKFLHGELDLNAAAQDANAEQNLKSLIAILNKHGDGIRGTVDTTSATQKALTAHEEAQVKFARDCLTGLRGTHDAIRALTKLLRPFLIGGAVAAIVVAALFFIGLT